MLGFCPGFVRSHILEEHETEVIGEIHGGTLEPDEKSSSNATCKLCQLKKLPKVVVVTCDVDVKPDETFLWTQQVRRHAVYQCYCISLILFPSLYAFNNDVAKFVSNQAGF